MESLTQEQIWALARSVQPFAVEARRHLHRNPELSYQEKETSEYLAAQLQGMGLKIQTGIGGFGIKVVFQGAQPGPTIALRADIDALPIQEETGLEFASCRPGVMHACGHDVHTATLLATAKALKEIAPSLPGQVVLIFQPGEEQSPGGASLMIKDGVLENPHVDAIFGLHVFPAMTAGVVALGAGPRLAAPDEFDVTIRGKGGHGAYPHLCIDPIMVACQCITLLQQVVARNVSPFEQAVITVGAIHGGAARNVIPEEVTFSGTVRTMDPKVRALMPERLEQVVRGVCDAAGATCEIRYDTGYPMLINDPACTDLARTAALAVLPEGLVQEMPATMGGEDFAFYLEQIPGSFARLGSSAPGVKGAPGLHTPRLMIDEECMATGVAYYLSLVQHFFAQR